MIFYKLHAAAKRSCVFMLCSSYFTQICNKLSWAGLLRSCILSKFPVCRLDIKHYNKNTLLTLRDHETLFLTLSDGGGECLKTNDKKFELNGSGNEGKL